MPLGEPGRSRGPAPSSAAATPMPIRDDLDVPVIMVQTETDLLGGCDYLPARQPDSAYVRLWEVAGTAHADQFQYRRVRGAARLPAAGQPRPAGLRRPRRAALAGRRGRGAATPPDGGPLEVGRRRVRARRGRQRPWWGAHAGGRRSRRGAARRHRAGRVVSASCSARTLPMDRDADPLRATPTARPTWRRTRRRRTLRSRPGFVLPRTATSVLAEARPDLVRRRTRGEWSGQVMSAAGPRWCDDPRRHGTGPEALRGVLLASRSCAAPRSTCGG